MKIRNLINLVLLLNLTFCFAQKSKNSLYILITEKSNANIVKSFNDTIHYEVCRFLFNKNCQAQYDLGVDNKGDLIKKINFKPNSRVELFELIYLNKNSDNDPILISKNKVKNVLTYEEIIEYVRFEDFVKVTGSFTDIYIINEKDIVDNFYIAKKVFVQKQKARL